VGLDITGNLDLKELDLLMKLSAEQIAIIAMDNQQNQLSSGFPPDCHPSFSKCFHKNLKRCLSLTRHHPSLE